MNSKIQQFLSAFHNRVGHNINVSYGDVKDDGVVIRTDYFIQIVIHATLAQKFTLWHNTLDETFGWETNVYTNPSWEFEFN